MKKRLFVSLLCVAVISVVTSSSAFSSQDTEQEQSENKKSDGKILADTLDELQTLYLSISSDIAYSDAVQLIKDSNLPYSEEKYNGSRQLQVAFTEGCTDQKYRDESGDYLQISFDYPSDENSANDDLSKYKLSFCVYCPEFGPTLISLSRGYYFSYHEPGNYIEDSKNKDDISALSGSMTKEEQLSYYFEHYN